MLPAWLAGWLVGTVWCVRTRGAFSRFSSLECDERGRRSRGAVWRSFEREMCPALSLVDVGRAILWAINEAPSRSMVEPLVSNRYIKPVCVRVRLCACAASASTTRTKAWFFVCTRHGQCRSRFRCRRRIACTHFRSLWDEMAETVSLMR